MRQWMMASGAAVLIAVGSARAGERVEAAAAPVDAKMADEARNGRGEDAARGDAAHARTADSMADSTGAAKQRDAGAGRKAEKKRAPQEYSPFEWNQASGG